MPRRPRLLLLVALATLACSGDAVNADMPASIAGTWRITWPHLVGTYLNAPIDCTTEIDFIITQTGDTFTGRQDEETEFSCVSNDMLIADYFRDDESIIDGIVSNTDVAFTLYFVFGKHSGTISGTTMSGTGQWKLPAENNKTILLSGAWTAVKR